MTLSQSALEPALPWSNSVFNVASPVSCLSRAARRRRIGTLYVSRKKARNASSQAAARKTLIQTTVRQPSDWAITPLMAGPRAPPKRGASMMRLMAEPRSSETNMSPMMAGLRTFEATARPVRARAAIMTPVLWLKAANIEAVTKSIFAPFTTGYRPIISESGAMNSGPAASPSSHIVTRRTLADLLEWPPSKSSTMRLATGTTEMHVKDLLLLRTRQFGFLDRAQPNRYRVTHTR